MASSVMVEPRDLNRFNPAARRAVILAGCMGWSVRWANKRGRIIALRHESKEILVPSTNVNANRARSWIDQIVRYSDPDILRDFTSGKWMHDFDMPSSKIVEALGAEVSLAIEKHLANPDAEPEVFPDVPAETPTLAPEPEPEEVADVPDTVSAPTHREQLEQLLERRRNRVLVSTRPWMARKGGTEGGGGRMYESPVVLVDTFSDGSIEYRCKFCAFTHENPRSVSAHASRSKTGHNSGDEPIIVRPVPVYEPSGFHRQQTIASRLAADITAALDSVEDWGSMDKADLAEALAQAIIEARPERAPAEPLTDEQIVRRITTLVDHGRLFDMHQQVEQMAAALAEANEKAEAALADAERLRDERAALKELLSDADA